LPASILHLREDSGVDLGRGSWIAVVVGCLIASLLVAINGYTGYALTLIAVGLAAAVNLT
jgi:hypothetical protein